MKTTLNLPDELVETAMKLSGRKTKTEIVVIAMEEYIRRRKLEQIIGLEGKLSFSDDGDKARHER